MALKGGKGVLEPAKVYVFQASIVVGDGHVVDDRVMGFVCMYAVGMHAGTGLG